MQGSERPEQVGQPTTGRSRKPASLELLDPVAQDDQDAEAASNLVALRVPSEIEALTDADGEDEQPPRRQETLSKDADILTDAAPADTKKAKKSRKPQKIKDKKVKAKKLKDESFKYDNVVPLDAAAGYFDDILAGLAKGTIQFEKGKKNLVVRPTESCRIKIKAARKGKKERVSFDMSWRTPS